MNVFEHKQEARNPFYRVVELTDETVDPAIWGKNSRLQYDGYRRTVDQVRTRYGGSEAVRVAIVAAFLTEIDGERVARPHRFQARVFLQARLRDDRARVGARRRARVQGLDARGDRCADAQGAASRVRVVKPGHSRAVRCGVRGLPHAVRARRRDEDQQPSRAQSGAEYQQSLPDLPQVARGELKSRIESIQSRTYEMRGIAMDALVALIDDIQCAKTAGATDAQLETARGFQRKAQFLLDFIEAENSMGFHAPQEAARILVRSVDNSRKGQEALR